MTNCSRPGCKNEGTSKCSGCGEASYCSKDCQKEHWAEHKAACIKVQASSIKSFGDMSAKQLKTVLTNKLQGTDKKRREKLLKKMEKFVEKEDLIKFVSEHVDISEVEKLLTVQKPTQAEQTAHIANKYKSKPIKFDGNFKPSANQMKEQANMMRNNPELVRRANAAFASYSDEQIRKMADEMDQMASNPDTLKEMERMFSLSGEDRNALQTIQEGFTGQRPIDEAWIDEIIKTLKENPDVFKTLFKSTASRAGADAGVTPDQIEYYIDMFSKLDTWVLKLIANIIWGLSKLVKPAQQLYELADKYTFGAAKYLLMGIFMLISYYVMMAVIYVFRIIIAQLIAFGLYLYNTINRNALPATTTVGAGSILKQAIDNQETGDTFDM